METIPDSDIRIVIVENDTENRTEKIIREFSAKSKFRICYYLETEKGLVFARNRSVKEAGDCDFCCFTDDDQIVPRNWLTELLRCQQEYNAAAVAGPTYPIFKKDVPSYIKEFHLPKTYPYGTIVKTAYTGCLLVKKEFLDLIEGPFDTRLNFTGGEDIYLTYLISDLGGVIRFNPNAVAYEIISENRAGIRYVIKRAYRTANTGLYVNSLKNTKNVKLNALPRLIMRLGNGLLLFFPFLFFGGKNKLKGLIKIVKAIGGFHFALGIRNQFYK
jgi:succinoglycan biosynthesis protein ExoM